MAIVDFDAQGVIFGWNRASEVLFGFTAAEAIQKSVHDLVFFDAPRIFNDAGSPPENSKTIRLTCVHKDGRRLECEWHISALKSDSGESWGSCAYIRDVTAEVQTAEAFKQQTVLLRRILDNMPIVLWTCDINGIFTLSDGSGLKTIGLERNQVVGLNVFELYASVEVLLPRIREALAGTPSIFPTEVANRHWDNRLIPALREDGTIEGILAISWDITERVAAERDLHQKIDLIATQERAIRTLSTPIMRIWREVLALPLVGTIDGARAEQILGTLLEAVVREQAQFVIMDMTGIGQVDNSTAEHLFRVLRALGLLGAKAIVTGIKPSVAQTLVELGVDMTNVITYGNLDEALRFVMKSQKQIRAAAKS